MTNRLRWPLLIRRVVGTSMHPTLRPGQVVLFWRTPRLRPGDIVLVYVNGREVVKRLHTVTRTSAVILGDNPSASTDSRHFGPIQLSAVSAVLLWPLRKDRRKS